MLRVILLCCIATHTVRAYDGCQAGPDLPWDHQNKTKSVHISFPTNAEAGEVCYAFDSSFYCYSINISVSGTETMSVDFGTGNLVSSEHGDAATTTVDGVTLVCLASNCSVLTLSNGIYSLSSGGNASWTESSVSLDVSNVGQNV